MKIRDINPRGRNKILVTKVKMRYVHAEKQGGKIKKTPLPNIQSKFICIKCPNILSESNENKSKK